MASVGCASSDEDCYAWVRTNGEDLSIPSLFQELGHNMGLAHSGRRVCGNPNGTNCYTDEPGDRSDPMGIVNISPADNSRTLLVCTNAAQVDDEGTCWMNKYRICVTFQAI
ncbi:hypothetical protein PLESTF_000370100 [Pleodorina starrii]|nr:hypothetical protein PLESTF_000370100 [Pleodorina starrii]